MLSVSSAEFTLKGRLPSERAKRFTCLYVYEHMFVGTSLFSSFTYSIFVATDPALSEHFGTGQKSFSSTFQGELMARRGEVHRGSQQVLSMVAGKLSSPGITSQIPWEPAGRRKMWPCIAQATAAGQSNFSSGSSPFNTNSRRKHLPKWCSPPHLSPQLSPRNWKIKQKYYLTSRSS